MEKLKILIIDDEYRIAQLIGKLIHWDKLEARLLGLYEDSVKAFEAICENRPDIVISDIKMPVMDGMELIKKTREREIPVHFVLVSGFREFEYAHQALKFGVEDYLLKPVKEIDLNQVIAKICEKSQQEWEQMQEKQRFQEEVVKSRKIMNRDALSSLESDSSRKNIQTFNSYYECHLVDELVRVMIVQLDHHKLDQMDGMQDQIVLNHLSKMMEECLSPYIKEQIHAIRSDMTLNLVLNYEQEQSQSVKKAVYQTFTNLKTYIYGFSGYEVTIGFGSEECFDTIQNSVQAARSCIASRILLGTGKLIAPQDYTIGNDWALTDVIHFFKNDFVNARDTFSETGLHRVLDAWNQKLLNTNGLHPGLYYESAAYFTEIFFQGFGQSSRNMESKKAIAAGIPLCYSPQMLCRFLKEKLSEAMRNVEEEKQQQTLKPVREAIKYLEANYGQKINLEDVALRIGLNATYFAVVFKKETGKTFLAYLTELRIEKAKELLRTTNDTMSNIAEKVGYGETRYFSQCFVKVVGMKPSIYRRTYS